MAGDPADWLVGGGEMAAVIRTKDWSTTALGPIARWPQSLRTTVSLVQASNSPIALIWGRGHTQIYNDGYWPICGRKHPGSMGQDFRACWASAFPVIGEAYATAWSGHSAYLEKVRMFLDRFGFLEETWFTFSFSPITDESGGVGGLFHPVTEMTGQMLSERRTQTVRDLAFRAAHADTAADALRLAAEVFAGANLDVPFAMLYLLDDGATRARRVGYAGISAAAAGPELIALDGRDVPWRLAEVARSGEIVYLDDGAARIAEPVGPYPEVPRHIAVLPIRRAGAGAPIALLVAGVSPRLVLTDAYRMFFELVAAAVGTAVTNACALEDERQKSQVLAELDRAKTAFFSSVSHEFRTPLTLILGPLEDALADAGALPAALRGSLDTMHRNALRLLRLVNTLLDFSRIEAGRLRAIYEPVDLSSETLQLASVFRAATEHAGLELVVDCPALPEPVFIDREMWEKIVFNLLSNALKHTARGAITVSQRWDGERVTLRVADTGVGIAEHELPRVFERFHRVHGAWSRSHEGTGIGLALVRELARALGGDVEIASRVGIGTTVSVMLRTGSAHLPADHVAAGSPRALERIGTAFVEEAVRWNPDPAPAEAQAPAAHGRPDGAPRIVLADDNADMRDYVSHLLADHFEIEAVADGAAALDAIRARIPDLVLSDVMMPRLDGLGLVAALRAEPKTRTLPVILLSARAGTEASTEGIDAGADDYLIKPFAARELVARVRTHIALARTRRAWAAELERANRELEAFSYSVSHDLSAPLRGIANFAQLLLDDDAPQDLDDRRAAVQRIASNAARMRAIIEDLLALSQVSSGELRRESVNLTAIARRVLANLRLRDPSRVVEVTVSEGMTATGDSRLVQIALENLLANAWKFTSKRDAAKIAIDCEAGVFAIHDNGAGFDMAASDHLFEPFQRLHASADFEGTGIGLAIVRRIVERHGGQVWAHGVVDGGATVRFTLRGDP